MDWAVSVLQRLVDAGGLEMWPAPAMIRWVEDVFRLDHDAIAGTDAEPLVACLASQLAEARVSVRTSTDSGLVPWLATRGPMGVQAEGVLTRAFLAMRGMRPQLVPCEPVQIGRHSYHHRAPCGPEDQCYFGPGGFARQFPLERFTPRLAELNLAWRPMAVLDPIVEESSVTILSEYILGISVRDLDRSVRARGHRISLNLALLLVAQAQTRLAALHRHGVGLGHLTAARIKFDLSGMVRICAGTSSEPPDASPARDLCDVARIILEHALDDPSPLELLRSGERSARVVLADSLIEQHPELDELIALVLRDSTDPEPMTAVLMRSIPPLDALRFYADALIALLAEPPG